jgi:hypothetical protein
MTKKAHLLLFLLALGSALACQAGPGQEDARKPSPSAAPAETRAPRPAVAQARLEDDLAAFMSGLPGTSEAWKSRQDAQSWQTFAKFADEHWNIFDTAILEPMKRWAGQDLRESGLVTKTLFYPFGGPDFVTAYAFYPDSEKTVLMGLESSGNLPDFEGRGSEWMDLFFLDFDKILSDFFKRGYFVTEHMNEIYARGRVDGALPLIVFFLKRTGHSVVGVRRLSVDGKGDWVEEAYAPLKKLPKRPSGVRIEYVSPGDRTPRSVYYFSCDLADTAFRKDSPLFRFVEGLGEFTTFIKSASYLLHYGDFANIRTMILQRSAYVLEDDTGIPYRYFKRQGWDIQLYGVYVKPIKDFPDVVEQKDLEAAYADPSSNVKKLPFHFGYRWVSKIDNLLLMKKPQEKPGVS